MSIATQITALQADKTAIANAITAKGGTVAAGDGFDDFATDIATIPSAVTTDYLCFTGLENGCTLSFNFGDTYGADTEIYTSRDKATWTRYTLGTNLSFGLNEKVYFKGTAPTEFYSPRFTGSGDMSVSGNPMTMFDENGTLTEDYTEFPEDGDYRLNEMFSGMSDLVSAAGLTLSATTLSDGCYQNMFSNCTSLTSAPVLPAMTVPNLGYEGMFSNCTELETAPELPATTVGINGYKSMFAGCSELTTPPSILPALTMAEKCYYQMFYGCGSLTSAPELPATTLAESCYEYMFYQCGLTTAPELPAMTLAKSCYRSMFEQCTGFELPPALPATILAEDCYVNMFCFGGITTLPAFPATTLAKSCYASMFSDCIGVGVRSNATETYTHEWRVPETGTGIDAEGALTSMFARAGGSVRTPEINTTYYTTNAPVSKTIRISANGTYDVSQKNSAVVNVPSTPTPTQAKTLTLGSAAPSAVTPDSGYALSSVTPTIDSSVIKAENIAQGATILGIAGTHSGGGGGGSSIYKFYLQDGTTEIPMANWNVAGLANAYYYTKNGGAQQRVGGRIFHINCNAAEGTADKFYAYNNTSGYVDEIFWTVESHWFGGLSVDLGSGKSNTAACVAYGLDEDEGSIFDWLVNAINGNSVGGCNDWYIPSCMEFDMLRTSLNLREINLVWSSSEGYDEDENYARLWDIDYGGWTDESKDNNHGCVFIRSF